jgi:hypothetical protein
VTYVPNTSQPVENIGRGTLFALGVVPLAIIAWLLLSRIGFIASIVGYGAAAGAVWLYLRGSGGRISRNGAIRITIIVIGSILLAILADMIAWTLPEYVKLSKMDWMTALTSPAYWNIVTNPDVVAQSLPSILIGLGLSALGCFSILRNAFRATAAPATATQPEQITPKDAPPIPPAPGA